MKNIIKLLIALVIMMNNKLYIYVMADEKNSVNHNLYIKVFDYIKSNRWNNAEKTASKLKNKTLVKIILSQKFLDSNYKEVDFYKITKFLKENPKWPQYPLLKIKAENLLDEKVNIKEIYNWFKKHKPLTGNGYKYYALAAAQLCSNLDIVASTVKNAWINGDFNNEQEVKLFFNRFKKFLKKNDHIKRIDNLIYKGSTKLAKNSLNLVETGYQEAFKEQIAFIEKKDKSEILKKISKDYYTPGLVYQYIKSKKDKLPKSEEIVTLINSIKHYQLYGNNFWKLQSYLAREYIENRRFDDAYIVASTHFAQNPENISEAEFLSGWLALRFLNKPQIAIKHLKKFLQIVKTPISLSRGFYWLARAYDKNGKKEEAAKLYKRAANNFGYTFYGQLSMIEIGVNELKLPPKMNFFDKKKYNVLDNEILKATNLIVKYGTSSLAKIYLDNLIGFAKGKQEILAIIFGTKTPHVHHKIWLSRAAMQKHVFLDCYSFLDPYKIEHLPIEKALTYSIIRQESSFEKSVIAVDKGMGLMQLMEKTACDTAKKLEIKCNLKNLTYDPYYNLTLGSYYLANMLEQHKNYYVLAIAAYNAGPYRVKKWLTLYGDLKTFKEHRHVVDWIESIPFSVTRNYVQRVLENLQIYRAVLNKDKKLKLKEDLLGKSIL